MINTDMSGVRWDVKGNVTPRGLLSTKIINAVPASQSEYPAATVSRPSILRTGREFVTTPADHFPLQVAIACAGFVTFLLVMF